MSAMEHFLNSAEPDSLPEQVDFAPDVLPKLVNFYKSSCSLSSQQFIEMISKFINNFDIETMTKIIFHGLYTMNKTNSMEELTQFLNETINDTLSTQRSDAECDVIESSSSCLINLDQDTLNVICQYLQIKVSSTLT